ncbi:MAG: hypothetical protein OEV87_08905 [Phycisphaerae bacterium]|nr:hypothetical protein [Phycisphaerae bacterium]
MQSELFQKNNFARNEDFIKDATELLELEGSQFSKVVEYAIKDFTTRTTKETNDNYEKASSKIGVTTGKLKYIFNIASFFIRQFALNGDAYTDEPSAIADDLIVLLKTEDAKKELLEQFLDGLKRYSQEDAGFNCRKSRYASACLPNIKGIFSVLDYRVVFDKELKTGEEAEDVDINCIGVTPVGILKFVLTSDENSEVLFQVEKEAISVVINELELLLKKMEIAKDYLNLSGN